MYSLYTCREINCIKAVDKWICISGNWRDLVNQQRNLSYTHALLEHTRFVNAKLDFYGNISSIVKLFLYLFYI